MKKISLILLVILLGSCAGDSNSFMNRNKFENLVKRFEDPTRTKSQKPDEVIALFGDIAGKKIMDIGAGTGYFSFRLADKGAKVIAADVDDRFLNYIEEKRLKSNSNSVSTRKVEYEDPLLKKEEVDHVIIVNTYHHIEDREAYFTKVKNGIKREGSLMVVDFKKEAKSPGPPKKYRVAVDKVKEELMVAGFDEFEVNNDLLETQYIVIAR